MKYFSIIASAICLLAAIIIFPFLFNIKNMEIANAVNLYSAFAYCFVLAGFFAAGFIEILTILKTSLQLEEEKLQFNYAQGDALVKLALRVFIIDAITIVACSILFGIFILIGRAIFNDMAGFNFDLGLNISFAVPLSIAIVGWIFKAFSEKNN